jgi:hypothetical protein
MKRLLIALILVLVLAVPAMAVEFVYSPDAQYLAAEPGETVTVPFTVGLDAYTYRTYYLWYIWDYEGTIPFEWLRTARRTSFLSKWWPTATTDLSITVPSDAVPGVYDGYIDSYVMGVHATTQNSTGLYLNLTVTSACAATPEIVIDGVSPDVLWPPNGSLEEVLVSGYLSMDEGCSLFDIAYSVDDEYGLYTSEGVLYIDEAGAFEAVIPVQASRDGQDKDGRHYTVSIFAENEAGIGQSEAVEILVPHDKRK